MVLRLGQAMHEYPPPSPPRLALPLPPPRLHVFGRARLGVDRVILVAHSLGAQVCILEASTGVFALCITAVVLMCVFRP